MRAVSPFYIPSSQLAQQHRKVMARSGKVETHIVLQIDLSPRIRKKSLHCCNMTFEAGMIESSFPTLSSQLVPWHRMAMTTMTKSHLVLQIDLDSGIRQQCLHCCNMTSIHESGFPILHSIKPIRTMISYYSEKLEAHLVSQIDHDPGIRQQSLHNSSATLPAGPHESSPSILQQHIQLVSIMTAIRNRNPVRSPHPPTAINVDSLTSSFRLTLTLGSASRACTTAV